MRSIFLENDFASFDTPDMRMESIAMRSVLWSIVSTGMVWTGCAASPAAADPKPKVVGWAQKRCSERLGRGLVVLRVEGNRVYLSWRLLTDDPKETGFNVYRSVGADQPIKLNKEPITKTTDFTDASPPASGEATYVVRPAVEGKEGPPSERATVRLDGKTDAFLTLKLAGPYTFQKVGIADLNGDGTYDFVIKQPNSNIDPYERYWHRSEGTYKIEAYLSDGTFLWRNDLGWSIEQGIWYSPYVVYDLDGDGKAEVAVKTGEGDPRDPDGRVTSGPEYLSIWDGMTGKQIARVPWPTREGFPGSREVAYNYSCRNQLGITFLDGKTPCLIVARGTYNIMKVVAYQYHGGQLKELWCWDNRQEKDVPLYRGQGAHFMHAVDIDGVHEVGALTAVQWDVLLLAVIPAPELFELPAVVLVRDDLHDVVRAAGDDQAGRLAVEEGDSKLIPAGVVVGHFPGTRKALPSGPRNARDLLAGHPIPDRQVLRSGRHTAIRIARVALSGLDGHLGFAVTVEVVHDVGRVPDALLDRPAQVVPPQKGPVAQVGLDLVGPFAAMPIALVRIDVAVGLLDDEVVRPVAVEIGDTDLLERVRPRQFEGQKGIGLAVEPDGGPFRRRAFLPLDGGSDDIGRLPAGRRGSVREVGRFGDRFLVQLDRLVRPDGPIDVETRLLRIVGKEAPAQVDPISLDAKHHEPATEALGTTFLGPADDLRFGIGSRRRCGAPRPHHARADDGP